MDHQEVAKKNMVEKLLKYIKENDSAYPSTGPYMDALNKLDTDNTSWASLMTDEAADTHGATDTQETRKHNMAKSLSQLANGARAYALTIGDSKLAGNLDHSEAEIFRLANAEAASTCDQIIEAVNSVIGSLAPFGITSTNVTAAQATISSFRDSLGVQKAGQGEVSAASQAITRHIHDNIDPDLEILDALTDSILFASNPDYVSGYHAVRKIDDLPSHPTELDVQVYRTGTTTGIGFAQGKLSSSAKSSTADATGKLTIKRFKGGNNLVFEFSATGYVTKQIIQTVKRGKKVSITVYLDPA